MGWRSFNQFFIKLISRHRRVRERTGQCWCRWHFDGRERKVSISRGVTQFFASKKCKLNTNYRREQTMDCVQSSWVDRWLDRHRLHANLITWVNFLNIHISFQLSQHIHEIPRTIKQLRKQSGSDIVRTDRTHSANEWIRMHGTTTTKIHLLLFNPLCCRMSFRTKT